MEAAALRHWVTESTRTARAPGNSLTVEARIQTIINNQAPLEEELVVFRGHTRDRPYILPESWFSTSTNEAKVRRQHIANGASCCLFKIHVLPGVKVLHVDAILREAGLKPTGYDESEVIVDGKGFFYETPRGTSGYRSLGNRGGVQVLETWYSPVDLEVRTELTANRLVDRISPNEYNFINTVNDLRTSPGLLGPNEYASNRAFINAFNLIKKPKKTRKARRKNHLR